MSSSNLTQGPKQQSLARSPAAVVDLTSHRNGVGEGSVARGGLTQARSASPFTPSPGPQAASSNTSMPKSRPAPSATAPASSPTPSSGSSGRGRGSTRGRPFKRKPQSPEAYEAQKARQRARYVPKARSTPKTAKSLNPDYVAYSSLEQRPWGIEAFDKDEHGRIIIRQNELFCRVGNEETGEMCTHTKRFSGTTAVSGHVRSGKHRLRVAPLAFVGDVETERADNNKFYKDVMAKHRELGGPEPILSQEEQDDVEAREPSFWNAERQEYVPDLAHVSVFSPGPNASPASVAPSLASSARDAPSMKASAPLPPAIFKAANAPTPAAAFNTAAFSQTGDNHRKRKRTEAERELRTIKKELQLSAQLRVDLEVENQKLRRDNEDLLLQLQEFVPALKRPKIDEKGAVTVKAEDGTIVKTEEGVEIKQENAEYGLSDAITKETINKEVLDQIAQADISGRLPNDAQDETGRNVLVHNVQSETPDKSSTESGKDSYVLGSVADVAQSPIERSTPSETSHNLEKDRQSDYDFW